MRLYSARQYVVYIRQAKLRSVQCVMAVSITRHFHTVHGIHYIYLDVGQLHSNVDESLEIICDKM